jgi:uncharacterized iron-regulated protein
MKLLTRKQLTFIPLCISFLTLTACSMSRPPIGNPEAPYPPVAPLAVGDIFHPATGTLVSQETMLSIASDSRIIYVGETHDNPASHRLQFDVLKATVERSPVQVTLGMEMFTPAQQPVLDRWSAGELDEKTFLREVDWFSVWKGDFDLYRDLLHFAREHHIPVIGLNADKNMVRTVGGKPLEELTAEERATIPELDLTDPYHAAMVKAIYGDHVKSEGRLAGFQRVQALWDDTMAASIVTYLQSPQGEGKKMVVLAGGNHVRHGFGIPRRVFRQFPTSYTLIGSREIEIPESRQAQLMHVNMPNFPMLPYDFIALTRYEDEPKKVKLGVQFEAIEGADGIKVTGVVPGSAADLAGLKEGDSLLQIDGELLHDSFDLIYGIGQKSEGETITLTYEREGEQSTTEALLKPLTGHKP